MASFDWEKLGKDRGNVIDKEEEKDGTGQGYEWIGSQSV